MSFFSERRVGELNSRISSDISLLQDSLTGTLADLLSQMLVIIGGITFMMISSYQLTLFTLAIVPAMALFASTPEGQYAVTPRRHSHSWQNQIP